MAAPPHRKIESRDFDPGEVPFALENAIGALNNAEFSQWKVIKWHGAPVYLLRLVDSPRLPSGWSRLRPDYHLRCCQPDSAMVSTKKVITDEEKMKRLGRSGAGYPDQGNDAGI